MRNRRVLQKSRFVIIFVKHNNTTISNNKSMRMKTRENPSPSMDEKEKKISPWYLYLIYTIGLLLLIGSRFIFKCWWENVFWCKYSRAVLFTFLIIIVCILASSYISKVKKNKGDGSVFSQIGQDVSNLVIKLFSLDGLIFLLVCAVISGVVYIILNSATPPSNDDLQWLSLTLTLTLAALIPTLITRIVTKNQINEIVDEKVSIELRKYQTSINIIKRSKAHSCRMSAILLEHIADYQKEEELIDAAWSIGWASYAVIQYITLRDNYPSAKDHSAECIATIYQAKIDHLDKRNNSDNNDHNPNSPILYQSRDLKSLIKMHSLIRQFGLVDELEKKAINVLKKKTVLKTCEFYERYNLILEDLLHNIEIEFYMNLDNPEQLRISRSYYTIDEMPDEFNNQLDKMAKAIVKEILETVQNK